MLLAHAGAPALPPTSGAVLLALVVIGAATCLGGWLGLARRGVRPAAVVAGSVLLVTAVFGTAPAAVHAADEAGAPQTVLPLLVLLGLLAPGRLRHRFAGRVCGRLGVGGLVAHRLLEGAAVGAGLAVDARAGLLVLLAVAVHGACEGLVLTSYLSALSQDRRAALTGITLLCVAPLAGVALWQVTPVPSTGALVVLALLTGLFLSMSATSFRAVTGDRVRTPLAGAACVQLRH